MLKLGPLTLPDVSVMGVLNVTPDSFSDGGRFIGSDDAKRQVERMLDAGVHIIDVGGESTRPGAEAVTVDDELRRVMPVIEMVRSMSDVAISIDTTKPDIMRAAVAAGVGMVNDVRALQDDGALEAVASLDCAVCLMHMQGIPRTMQADPTYDDVVGEITTFLGARRDACLSAGIERERIVLDPGFGFGKRVEHNLVLLNRLASFESLGHPLLVGLSRKSMLGAITGRAVDERLAGSIVAAAIAVQNGASIVRVHDVAETVDAVRVVQAVSSEICAELPQGSLSGKGET